MFVINELFVGLALVLGQQVQAPSIAFDPASAQATGVDWTITLSAPYCGGFRIGDGVYVQPQPPLTLPSDVPADAVLFDGQPADVLLQGGALRVAPSHTLAQPMFCQTGSRQFTVELPGSLGLTNPDAGDYAVDVWFGSDPGSATTLPVTVSPPSACDPIQQRVDAATGMLQSDNAALANTFDAIRAQTTPLTAQAPGLAASQADLVRQLDDVQAAGRALATNGYNPNVAVAAPAIDWAHGPAQADLDALQNTALQPPGAPQPSVAKVISLVQLAETQADDASTASLQLQDLVQQFGDCGLTVTTRP